MCGAFSFRTRDDALKELYPWLELDERLPESFNIRPKQPAPVVPNEPLEVPGPDGEPIPVPDSPTRKPARVAQFGFDVSFGSGLVINTRDDTLLSGKGYWQKFRNNRCLILADGFYEWQLQEDGKSKQPFYFQVDGGRTFAFAGLYRFDKGEDGSKLYMSILTTEATSFVAKIHNTKKRMPVILHAGQELDWISPDKMSLEEIGSFLGKYPEKQMDAHPVSSKVGSPKNDGPDLIVPIEDQKKLI